MTTQPKQSQKWFYGVDSIRFVLAFIVMLSHFDNVWAESLKHSTIFPLKIAGAFLANAFDGTSAVIAFFIISGFVIHYPVKSGIVHVGQFWVRRFVRIIIPLAVILIAGAWFNHPEKTVTWSLYCELVYYAIYPALVKINLSWKTKTIIAWLVAAAFIGIGAFHDVIALVRQTDTGYHGYYWQFGTYLTWIVGLPCWLLGVLIAEHIDKEKSISFKKVLGYRLIIFLISCFCSAAKFHGHLSYIISMNLFALLLYKWIEAEIIYYKSHQPYPWLERMGRFSYSLYLCHPLVFLLLKMYLPLNNFTFILFVALTIGIAYLFFLLIENPSHKLARRMNRVLFPAVK